MGNGTYYGLNGKQEYYSDGTVIRDSKGLHGKVITEIGDTEYHSSLPKWSKGSKIYFKRDDTGIHPIEQMRVFEKRRAFLDFDWNHSHKNFKRGTVHVHEWGYNTEGKWSRSKNPRYMSEQEIKKYGELLKNANSDVKFLP